MIIEVTLFLGIFRARDRINFGFKASVVIDDRYSMLKVCVVLLSVLRILDYIRLTSDLGLRNRLALRIEALQ